MRTRMAFGTRKHIGWIPCPTSGLKNSVTRQVTTTAHQLGAPAMAVSAQSYKTFDLSWTEPYEDIRPVLDAFEYNDGPPYYFLDPVCLHVPGTNALPANWANPGRFVGAAGRDALSGGKSIVATHYGPMHTALTTRADSFRGAPTEGVTFFYRNIADEFVANKFDGGTGPVALTPTVEGTLVHEHYNPSATLLVPPGWCVFLAVSAESVDTNLSVVEAQSASGVLPNTVRSATWSAPLADGQFGPFGFEDNQWTMLDIGIMPANPAVTTSQFTLYGMSAVYYPIGSIVKGRPETYPFTEWAVGIGHGPLFPTQNELSITTYKAFDDQLTSLSLPVSEGYIPW